MAGTFLRALRMHSAEDIQLTTRDATSDAVRETCRSKSSVSESVTEPMTSPSSSSSSAARDLTAATCLVCLETHRQPKLLSCSHVFCEMCLFDYCRLFTADTTTHVPCPVCRQTSHGYRLPAPPGADDRPAAAVARPSLQGTSQQCDMCEFSTRGGVKADFHCAACAMNFCRACRRSHDQQTLFHTHTVVHLLDKEVLRLHCQRHNQLASLYFCLDCATTACTVCVLQDHSGHSTARLCELLSTRRDNINTLLQSMNPTLSHLEQRVHRLRRVHNPPSHSYLRRRMSSASDIVNGKLVRGSSERDLCCHHVELLRCLYWSASVVLGASHSGLLLSLYEALAARLRTALDVELVLLCHAFETRLDCPLETAALVRTAKTSPKRRCQALLYRPRPVWRVERYDGDELWNPCAVTFLRDGLLAVAAYDTVNEANNGLHLFDATGQALTSIAQGQVKPLGVTTTREGLLATTDCLSKRVRLYTTTGRAAGELGKGQFGWPYGIVVNSRGQFIVTDAFNDTVSIFQPDGKRLLLFGSSGSGPSQFHNPYHVAVDSLDNIIVADSGNNAVKIFDSCANFLFSISTIHKGLSSELGGGRRQYKRLKGPRGVCTDMKGNIIVADEHARISLFDATGTYIRSILTDEDAVKNPEAVACSNDGLMAVTEWNPNSMFAVKVYSIYE